MRTKKESRIKTATSKIVSVLLAVAIIAVGMPFTAFAEASATPPAYVTSTTTKALWAEGSNAQTTNNIDAVRWHQKNGKYYWFLPSSADLSNLIVYHNFESVKINGTAIISGNSYNMFENNQTYTVTADGADYTLCVQKATGIGSIFLTTESGSMRKIHATKGTEESGQLVAIDYDGSVSYDNELDSIKGRGHSTWALPKKPYNIKLAKKASLLGMDKNKKWCLLANAQDHSMIRNKLMYDLAHEAGLEFSPDSRFVDLYANGQYLGTYQVTQKVEAGDGDLVDITDLEAKTEDAVALATGIEDVDLEELYGNDKYSVNTDMYYGSRTGFNIPYNPEDITGGYLMEFIIPVDEPSSFITSNGQPVNVKAPEFCSAEQINYIADFMQELEDALYSPDGYNSKGKHFTEYIDIKSAAIMYLIQEYSLNLDGGLSSCYFYKDSKLTGDGKVHASPAWDFDIALGNITEERYGVYMTDYNSWFAKNAYGPAGKTIFAALCNHEDFIAEVEKVWKESFAPALDIALGKTEGNSRLQSIYQYDALLESSSIMNYTRWDLKDTLLVPNSGNTQDEQIKYLETFANGRFEFMNSYFSDVLGYLKKDYLNELDSIISEIKNMYSEDIPEEKATIDKLTKLIDQAKTDINNSQSASEVENIFDELVDTINNSLLITIYFDNSITKWDNVYLYAEGYAWIDEFGNLHKGEPFVEWPGTKMTPVGNNMYKFTFTGDISDSLHTVTFTNGESEESENRCQTSSSSIYNFLSEAFSGTFIPSDQKAEYSKELNAYIYDGRWNAEELIGDVSKNSAIDLMDAVLIMKHLVGSYELDKFQLRDADIDGNDKIELIDAVYIQKYLLGLI